MFDASDDCSSVTREVDADVVLLVVDAASVIGREDLLLLGDAAASGTPVVVALTRVDVYRDWQAVRRRDAEILASHCTAFAQAPVVPIAPGQEQSLVAVVSRAAREREAGGFGFRSHRTDAPMIEMEIRNLRDSVPGAELRAERSQLLTDRDGRRGERLVQVRSRLQRAARGSVTTNRRGNPGDGRRGTCLGRCGLASRIGQRADATAARGRPSHPGVRRRDGGSGWNLRGRTATCLPRRFRRACRAVSAETRTG